MSSYIFFSKIWKKFIILCFIYQQFIQFSYTKSKVNGFIHQNFILLKYIAIKNCTRFMKSLKDSFDFFLNNFFDFFKNIYFYSISYIFHGFSIESVIHYFREVLFKIICCFISSLCIKSYRLF